ncbi:hypothetical protein Forpe1208_v011837 [Fusarium oxysporum f. sp. rapae]|uniref:Uncharacterized protein n=1 Tax=Fusarium oxysporum f. sp. rapae TaxID=485398 RepID=A0A8J5NNG2_FUSOX|nr:hypothetical protein Forpe1208_v011837 [Fusarium oxysporum f. sp. rapae]
MLEHFLHFFWRLALHRYPHGYPIPSLLKVLCQASTEELFNIVQVGYLRTIHCLERSLGSGNAVVLSVWSNYMKKADDQALPASALTSRYESVLQEAQNSFTPTGTRTIEILHGYTYAAYYNANNYDLAWNLASQMINLAESFELMDDHPEWCLATQGYAMAAKLLILVTSSI